MTRRPAFLALIASLGAAGLLILLTNPPCVFYAVTGLKCAGCGMTRAVHAAMRGDFAGAFRLNALMVTLTPLLAGVVIVSPRAFLRPWFVFSLIALLAAWAVLRNIAGI